MWDCMEEREIDLEERSVQWEAILKLQELNHMEEVSWRLMMLTYGYGYGH